MKTIKIRISDSADGSLKFLSDYFKFPAFREHNGIVVLRDNSNYYSPVVVVECDKSDAEWHFVNYRNNIHLYYKHA